MKDLVTPAIHQPWMNGRKFKQGEITYTITEGLVCFVEGAEYKEGKLVWGQVLENVVRFTDGKTNFEMPEKRFFKKVKLI